MDLFRAIVELRYIAPRYLDTRGIIITKFVKQYPEFAIEFAPDSFHETVRMKNEQRGVSVFANGAHCGLEMNFEPFVLTEFAREASHVCRTIARDTLEIETILRLGMRFFYRTPAPTRDTVTLAFKHLLPGKEIAELNISNITWNFTLEADDDRFRYAFQPYLEREKTDGGEKFTGNIIVDVDVCQITQPISAITSLREMILEAQILSQTKGEQVRKGLLA